ncbi:MAG: sensor histidine kinase [Alphaproteobacteria bacterium]|nr:sensor histidine kinase [Alphaproteobacteria bacterium]
MPLFGSIKRRLIALHLIAILAVAVVLPLALYWRVDATARALHERALRDQAEQIAQYLHQAPDGTWALTLPDAVRLLYSPGYARYGFSILTQTGEVLFTSLEEREPLFRADPRRDRPSYFERQVGKSRYFGASVPITVQQTPLWVQISQDQAHRDVLIDDIVEEFLPHVGWVIIPILLVLLGIDLAIFGRTLRPLEEASRFARQIGPTRTGLRLPEAKMPGDVLPLVRAVNEALDRLERAFITQREFVADASHELRTPLAILRAQVEALGEQDTTRELIGDIDNMTRIVNQLLDFAESDTLTIKSGDVADLRSVSAEVAVFMAPVAVASGKNIAVAGPANPVWVHGNAAALFQAIRNLTENAIAHTAPGTVVEISVGSEGSVTISDDGPGIPVEQRDLIFQRFWRGDRRRTGSAGLGLSIVARIVAAHAGQIEVRGGPHGGAVFAIKLRKADPGPINPSQPPVPATAADTTAGARAAARAAMSMLILAMLFAAPPYGSAEAHGGGGGHSGGHGAGAGHSVSGTTPTGAGGCPKEICAPPAPSPNRTGAGNAPAGTGNAPR